MLDDIELLIVKNYALDCDDVEGFVDTYVEIKMQVVTFDCPPEERLYYNDEF